LNPLTFTSSGVKNLNTCVFCFLYCVCSWSVWVCGCFYSF